MNTVAGVLVAGLYPNLMPLAFGAGHLAHGALVPEPSPPLHAHEHVFRAGDLLSSLYVVRSGSFKCYTTDTRGRENVTGFRFPGEPLGLDAISFGRHPNAALALETSTLWIYPYPELQRSAVVDRDMRVWIVKLVSQELCELAALNCDSTAEERVAHFLMDLSQRFALRGLSASCFNLSMSRGDIASHLRLAAETVTRVFTSFCKQALIAVDRREVRLLDPARLQRMYAEPEADTHVYQAETRMFSQHLGRQSLRA